MKREHTFWQVNAPDLKTARDKQMFFRGYATALLRILMHFATKTLTPELWSSMMAEAKRELEEEQEKE